MRAIACPACLVPLALVLSTAAATAQHVRTPLEPIRTLSGSMDQPVVATRGDLTVAMFRRFAPPPSLGWDVWVATSDGRALTWSSPQVLDAGTSGVGPETVSASGRHDANLRIRGDTVHALWNRVASTNVSDPYYARSTDRGATWSTPVRVDKGLPEGLGRAEEFVLAVSGTYVYVLSRTRVGAQYGVFLSSSTNAGQTFGPAVDVSQLGANGVVVEAVALVADGPQVQVAWSDDAAAPGEFDVRHVRSVNAGQSLGAVQQLDGSPAGTASASGYLSLDQGGLEVLATWTETPTGSSTRTLHGAYSSDGGASFTPAFDVRDASGAPGDVAWSRGALLDGALLATWTDDRFGVPDAFVARSDDHGATWTESALSFLGGARNPRLAFDPDERGSSTFAVVHATEQLAGEAVAAVTRDGGLTWRDQVVVSQATGDVEGAVAAYNARYGNLISAHAHSATVPGQTYRTYVGGLRPQGLRFSDLTAGGTPNVLLEGWEPTASPRFCWVLAAGQPGVFPLPFGDGRDLGLRYDGFFNVTLNNPGFFLTVLDPTGTGATPTFPLPGPAGITFYAAAVSFGLGAAGLAEVSDVVEFTIQ